MRFAAALDQGELAAGLVAVRIFQPIDRVGRQRRLGGACGAGALSMEDRDNYAILMRVAMLSSLEGDDVTGNLGFRCARDPAAGSTP